VLSGRTAAQKAAGAKASQTRAANQAAENGDEPVLKPETPENTSPNSSHRHPACEGY